MAAKKTTSVQLPKTLHPTFHYFRAPGKHRTHKLLVGGVELYVNGSSLAEHSEYFDAFFFRDFQEASEKSVSLTDEKLEDVLTLLNAIGANPKEEKTEVNVTNCPRLIRLADKLLVTSLQQLCKNFLEKDFCLRTPTIEETTEILVACELVGITGTPLFNVASRLAGFGKEKLKQHNVHKMIKCPRLSAALFLAAEGVVAKKNNGFNDYYDNDNNSKHEFGYNGNMETGLGCSVYNCSGVNAKNCHRCGFKFCNDHVTSECPKNSKAETKLVTLKTGWRELDKDFM